MESEVGGACAETTCCQCVSIDMHVYCQGLHGNQLRAGQDCRLAVGHMRRHALVLCAWPTRGALVLPVQYGNLAEMNAGENSDVMGCGVFCRGRKSRPLSEF